MLDGTFIYPSSCSQDTKDFLDNCQYENKTHTVKENSSGKYQYRACLKSWLVRRESTCSYGQHIGHYKAVLKHPFLSWLFYQRGNIPVISSYAPIRHRKCVDLMILKNHKTMNCLHRENWGF